MANYLNITIGTMAGYVLGHPIRSLFTQGRLIGPLNTLGTYLYNVL